MKTVIVVNGGDAPGINAAIAAYTGLASQNGDQVIGAQDGFAGLLSGQLTQIDLAAVSLLSGRGRILVDIEPRAGPRPSRCGRRIEPGPGPGKD